MNSPREGRLQAGRGLERPLSFRGWLRHLAATDRLAVAHPNVPLVHKLAAIAKRLDGEKCVYFPQPGGHAVPVVAGLASHRGWLAEAIGVEQAGLLRAFRRAVEAPIASRELAPNDAACQQIVVRDPDMRTLFPIPTHSEHDSGAYITAGLVIARNPRTGKQNVSINRIQVNERDRMALLILPRHLHAFHRIAQEMNAPLPVAVVIGVDPLVLLASQAIVPLDQDELEIAGALHGAPLAVAKCLTNDVRVPADAEIVIEGHILPHERMPEGPFGEFPKYYSAQEDREIIAIDAVTHRRDPIYHTIVPAEMEHLLLGAVPREASILAHLQRSFPNVLDVHLAAGGVCRYHLYVQMRKTREGEPKNVIFGALGAHYDIKHVVVVDDDVNVHDPEEVEWAIATRFQADRDLVTTAGALGSILDPSTTLNVGPDGVLVPGLSAKMGMDATKPLKYAGHVFTRVRIPGEAEIDLGKEIDGDGGRGLGSRLAG